MRSFVVISSVVLILLAVVTADSGTERKFADKVGGNSPEKKSDADNTISSSAKPISWQQIFSAVLAFFTSRSDGDGAGFRQLVQLLVSILDSMRHYFLKRSAESRGAVGLSNVSNNAISAAITMGKGYVKCLATKDEACMQHYLCEANREAVRDSREIGYIIGKAGSSIISYLLERSRHAAYDANYNASRRGLDGENCDTVQFGCNEVF